MRRLHREIGNIFVAIFLVYLFSAAACLRFITRCILSNGVWSLFSQVFHKYNIPYKINIPKRYYSIENVVAHLILLLQRIQTFNDFNWTITVINKSCYYNCNHNTVNDLTLNRLHLLLSYSELRLISV